MRVLAITNKPAYYQVPIFRGLAGEFGSDFMVLMGHSGQAEGCYEESWNKFLVFEYGMLDGYTARSLSLTDADMRKNLSKKTKGEIKTFLNEFSPDIIITNSMIGSFYRYVISLAKKKGAKVVARSTPNDLGKRVWWKSLARFLWYREQYMRLDAACAVSKVARDHFERHGVPKGRIFDANYCTDEWVLESLNDTDSIRQYERSRMGIPQDAVVACFAGKFIPIKRIDLLVELVARLANENNLYFIFAGDGPLWEEYQDALCGRGRTQVFVPGHLDRIGVAKLFVTSDFLLLPSDHETYGVVLQEAMMFGCSWVASSNVGAAYDLGHSEGCGKIFPAGDISAFELAVRESVKVLRTDMEVKNRVKKFVQERSADRALAGVLDAILYCSKSG